MSPRPPVCASGVHSEVMKRMRFLSGDRCADDGRRRLRFNGRGTGAGVGGANIAFPARAADCEASAMRTFALGETALTSSLGGSSTGCFFGAAAFAFAEGFAAGLAGGFAAGLRVALTSVGAALFVAEGNIDEEILLDGLLLPEEDFAITRT